MSFSIFYWAVANLMYIGSSYTLNQSFYNTSKTVSILFIVMIALYGTIRWFFNPMGGLYMFKRILVATILAASYLKNEMLAPLVVVELVFLFCRYVIERPDKNKLLFMMVG